MKNWKTEAFKHLMSEPEFISKYKLDHVKFVVEVILHL